MASQVVVDTVEAYLAAEWSGAPIRAMNTKAEAPEDGSAWIVVQYPAASETRMGLGRIFREEGAIRFVVNAPRGAGLAPGLVIADTLAGLFRGRRIGPIRTWAPSSAVIDDGVDRGTWCQLSFAVPFTRDFKD